MKADFLLTVNTIHRILVGLLCLFQYRPDFPSAIKEHSVFVDLAPRFQLMSEEILQRQIHLVIYNLKEVRENLGVVQLNECLEVLLPISHFWF